MTNIEEVWKDITGFEGKYQISNKGNVKSFCVYKSGKILKPAKIQGYLLADISRKKKFIHRLVAIHFIPNPENKPEVNHLDRNRHNNNDWNLEWATPAENCIHAVKTGWPRNNRIFPNAVKIEIVKRYHLGQKIRSISREFNVARSSIRGMIKKYIEIG